MEANLPAIVVLNKVDRQDARTEEVLEEVEQLFLDLAKTDEQLALICALLRSDDDDPFSREGSDLTNGEITALDTTVLYCIAGGPQNAVIARSSPLGQPEQAVIRLSHQRKCPQCLLVSHRGRNQ